MQSLRTYYSNGTSTMISLETEEEKSIYQFHDRMVSSHLIKILVPHKISPSSRRKFRQMNLLQHQHSNRHTIWAIGVISFMELMTKYFTPARKPEKIKKSKI